MKRTRAQRDEMDAPPARGTRAGAQLALQNRQAMNRVQLVAVRRAPVAVADAHANARNVRAADTVIHYGRIVNHQREGIAARITAKLVAARVGTAAGVAITGGAQPGVARGHLLARVLGGDGHEIRNLVPLAHEFTNLQQYKLIEARVLAHVLRQGSDAQRKLLGNVSLRDARDCVNDPIHRLLHTGGYYHEVQYEVRPRYANNDDVYPTSLCFVGRCATCGESVQKATVLANVVRR